MSENSILWTAHDIPLPRGIWNRLKSLGFQVVVEEGNGGLSDRIGMLTPRLWVGSVKEDLSTHLDTLSHVQEKCPESSVIFLSENPSVEQAVQAVKSGAFDYLPASVGEDRLWATVEGALKSPAPRNRNGRNHAVRSSDDFEPVAANAEMVALFSMARKIAPRRTTILVEGESGTGKEVLARYIHRNSDRKKKPFVAINCAALPDNLLESELFGHEKGAFTGAVSRKAGKFELADGGTLLLDEISEMAPSLQAKLLRVLQEGEIDRVGGKYTKPVDVRIIATTNRNLEEEIEKGTFRLDLYYRISVVPLKIPPLRDRLEDLGPLAKFFLEKHGILNDEPPKTLSGEAEAILKEHQWPGNVRELENLMERATLLLDGGTIGANNLQSIMHPSRPAVFPEKMGVQPLREMEKKMIFHALDENQGNRTHAAKMLGISVRTLRNKLNEYQEKQNELSKS
jgi:two-component system response regulator FlrC